MPKWTPENAPITGLSVYLDGVRQEGVTVADSDLGYIVRVKRNEDGTPKTRNGDILTETVRGRVMVIMTNA